MLNEDLAACLMIRLSTDEEGDVLLIGHDQQDMDMINLNFDIIAYNKRAKRINSLIDRINGWLIFIGRSIDRLPILDNIKIRARVFSTYHSEARELIMDYLEANYIFAEWQDYDMEDSILKGAAIYLRKGTIWRDRETGELV